MQGPALGHATPTGENWGGCPAPARPPHQGGWAGHAPGSLILELRRGSGPLGSALPSGVGDIPWDRAVLTLHGDQRHRGLPEIPEGRENTESAQIRTDHVQQHDPSLCCPVGTGQPGFIPSRCPSLAPRPPSLAPRPHTSLPLAATCPTPAGPLRAGGPCEVHGVPSPSPRAAARVCHGDHVLRTGDPEPQGPPRCPVTDLLPGFSESPLRASGSRQASVSLERKGIPLSITAD